MQLKASPLVLLLLRWRRSCCTALWEAASAGCKSATAGLEIKTSALHSPLRHCETRIWISVTLQLCHRSCLTEALRRKMFFFFFSPHHFSLHINHFLVLITATLEHPYKAIKNGTAVLHSSGTDAALMMEGMSSSTG